ncbi:hypothetical protein PR002_g744 [Phytophthora rubi]|uniref:Uncharacterized protein n=1 Tax=Phytophthora rubi TaxID=129364 RepID=A0A6A3NTR2_9STRA|nr:hypothetical protein PR002_g744 [Phytophthora rubi]
MIRCLCCISRTPFDLPRIQHVGDLTRCTPSLTLEAISISCIREGNSLTLCSSPGMGDHLISFGGHVLRVLLFRAD